MVFKNFIKVFRRVFWGFVFRVVGLWEGRSWEVDADSEEGEVVEVSLFFGRLLDSEELVL